MKGLCCDLSTGVPKMNSKVYILFCNLTYFSTVIRPDANLFLNMLYISDIHLWMYSSLYIDYMDSFYFDFHVPLC